jgi:hypothetical protein
MNVFAILKVTLLWVMGYILRMKCAPVYNFASTDTEAIFLQCQL